jgi:hypothetical protein
MITRPFFLRFIGIEIGIGTIFTFSHFHAFSHLDRASLRSCLGVDSPFNKGVALNKRLDENVRLCYFNAVCLS